MTVVMVATARPTFAVDTARQRADRARALLIELGAEVTGPLGLVMTGAEAADARRYVDRDADLVLNVCATFSDATAALQLFSGMQEPVLLWAFREPGPVGDRLWLNSLCGANLVGHALVRAGGQVRLLYGDPEEPDVRAALRRALAGRLPQAPPLPASRGERAPRRAARDALAGLRGKRIGAIGDPPPGFTSSEYDGALLEKLFGIDVDRLPVPDFLRRVHDVDPLARDRERVAAEQAQPSLMRLHPDEVQRHAAVTTALQQWTRAAGVDAVAVRCWPEFPAELRVMPCASLSRVYDAGTPTACERDVYGTVTMLLLEALGAGATYLVDTVDLDADRNVVRFWHCGSAATVLAADPRRATRSVHCNRRIGVAGDFALRTGRVVVARLTEDVPGNGNGAGLRLLISAGESLPEPNRFQGNTAAVRLDAPAADFVAGLVTGGFPHHTVIAWTDVRPALRAAADELGIPVIEWSPA